MSRKMSDVLVGVVGWNQRSQDEGGRSRSGCLVIVYQMVDFGWEKLEKEGEAKGEKKTRKQGGKA